MKNIKKSLLSVVAALSLGGLSGCDFFTKPLDFNPEPEQQEEQKEQEQKTVAVESLSLNTTALDLVVGQTETLTATILPADATNKTVTFKSSKETVATVSNEGVVTAVAKGTSVITVTSVDNPSKFENCVVTVEESIVHVESLEVNTHSVVLTAGSTRTIQATVSPNNATDKSLTWRSFNESVATVADGVVTAVANGNTVVTVKSNDNPALEEAIQVEVADEIINVTGVTIQEGSRALQFEETDASASISYVVSPENASDKSVTWSSSNPGVASVSATGVVTPHQAGTTTITVTTVDGSFTDTCEVTVTRVDVSTFTLDKKEITFMSNAIGENAKKPLTAIITPDNATYQEVEWSSNNPNIADVTGTGKNAEVQMKGVVGTAVITALHVQSHKTAACTVTVVEPNSLFVDLPISYAKSYDTYLTNIKQNTVNPDAEFVIRDQVYEVGDDNSINLRPQMDVYNDQDQKVDSNAWTIPFEITVERKEGETFNSNVSSSEYSVLSAVTCDIDFTQNAVGNVYRVSVMLGGYTEEELAEIAAVDPNFLSIKKQYLVKVVDGYNVTNEYEMAYLDTRPGEDTGNPNSDDDADDLPFTFNFPQFKADHGLKVYESENVLYEPANLVLHKDISLTAEHIPSEFFYDVAEANEHHWSSAEREGCLGTLKDYAYIYQKHTESKLTLSGNYFTFDFSRLPLVKRTNGLSLEQLKAKDKKTESHSKVFMGCDGSFEMKNLNVIGNAGAAKTQDDIYLAGGLIGFDLRQKCAVVTSRNVLSHNCYITIMNDGNWANLPNNADNLSEIIDCKFSDNYNCFIYNYGGKVVATRSKFEGCGGPVVIQDHIIPKNYKLDNGGNPVGGKYDEVSGDNFNIYGHFSKTEFDDCTIKNYVIGTEAWFYSFGATALVAGIKLLSDKLMAKDGSENPLGFLFDSNHKGTKYIETAGVNEDSLMNLIVINKSNRAENVTAFPVDGNVIFKQNGVVVDSFNYMNPVDPTAETTTTYGQVTAYDNTTYNDWCTSTPITGNVMTGVMFRGVQKAGAPVFETKGGHAAFFAAGQSQAEMLAGQVCSMEALAASQSVVDPDGTVYNDNGHIALYQTGMMLVFESAHYGI